MAQNLLAGLSAPQSPDLGASFLAGRSAVRDDQQQGLLLQQNKQTAAMRTAEIIGRYAVDADTPEKWAAAMQTAASLGVPDAAEFAGQFGKRDQIIRATQAVSDQLNTRTAGQFLGALPQSQPQGATLDGRYLASVSQPAATGAAPPVGQGLVGSAGTDTLRPTLVASESGGNPGVVNAQGYSGTYQMGEGALQTAGLYSDPTPGVKNDWQGSFSIPGYPQVRTHEDFLKSPQAQDAAFDVYKADLEKQINGLGLGQYVGQTVGGVPITEDGLIMMAHLGGVNGAKRFLQTGGKYDPSDNNGTRLSDYARRGAGTGGGTVRPATRDIQAPVPNGVPVDALQVLAQNPTYAGTAINTAIAQYGTPKDTTVWAKLDDGRLFNQRTGQVIEAPGGQNSGPFEGKALDAQDSNILLRGDPASPEYALAYQRQFMTPKVVPIPDPNNPGQMMLGTTLLQPPAGIRPPAGLQQPAPQGQPQMPSGASPQPQAAPQQNGGLSIQPVPGTSKPLVPTEQQRLDASFAARMEAANQALDQYAEQGASLGQRTMAGVPVLGNYLVSPEFQQFDQAKRDFVNAQLRRESGAAIGQSEFDNAERQYFPQPGDGPEVIAQKRAARQRAVENMRVQSGPAARAQAAPASQDVPMISNDAEYDALSSGQEFIAPDGSRRRKP